MDKTVDTLKERELEWTVSSLGDGSHFIDNSLGEEMSPESTYSQNFVGNVGVLENSIFLKFPFSKNFWFCGAHVLFELVLSGAKHL